jgi:hypothetical protein
MVQIPEGRVLDGAVRKSKNGFENTKNKRGFSRGDKNGTLFDLK